ncbi:MAG: 7TM-DISM domain-containing protein, partial [Treponema sp.]|nr:7TM-DISM domain-containing protein [Treponema sp.]
MNLQEFPLYVKAGFDLADTLRAPTTGEWKVVKINPVNPEPVLIMKLDLSGTPKRTFLSLKREKEMEFTLVIPFTMPAVAMDALDKDNTLIPGINLASLGDNWEIYLNGSLVKAEMDLDGEGRIISHRNYRSINFPVHKNLLNLGENILAIKIVGDPTFSDVGLFYATPYEIDSYTVILRDNNKTLTLGLIGIYLFMGIYHLFMFFARKKDAHNLYYGLFS